MNTKRYDSLAEKQKAYRERKRTEARQEEAKGFEERLPWPLNEAKAPRWGEGVAVYVPMTQDEEAALAELFA